PNVRGMGLREAVHTLESARYEVSFTGSGHVKAQNPPPGTKLASGSKVHLTLSE
ncbi:MAG: PASTA domain-containing protein, partial [Muribaculaceae bacterium]|nr:PASTA domain-containing protein [Muribaculaceae bacterium]